MRDLAALEQLCAHLNASLPRLDAIINNACQVTMCQDTCPRCNSCDFITQRHFASCPVLLDSAHFDIVTFRLLALEQTIRRPGRYYQHLLHDELHLNRQPPTVRQLLSPVAVGMLLSPPASADSGTNGDGSVPASIESPTRAAASDDSACVCVGHSDASMPPHSLNALYGAIQASFNPCASSPSQRGNAVQVLQRLE